MAASPITQKGYKIPFLDNYNKAEIYKCNKRRLKKENVKCPPTLPKKILTST
jgi:hypothetical protein